MLSYSLLSTLKSVVLMSLSCISGIWASSGTESVNLLCSFQWAILSFFFFFSWPPDSLLKSEHLNIIMWSILKSYLLPQGVLFSWLLKAVVVCAVTFPNYFAMTVFFVMCNHEGFSFLPCGQLVFWQRDFLECHEFKETKTKQMNKQTKNPHLSRSLQNYSLLVYFFNTWQGFLSLRKGISPIVYVDHNLLPTCGVS